MIWPFPCLLAEGTRDNWVPKMMYVFFCGKLPSKAMLSRALRVLGFPFRIKTLAGPLEKQSGYMPMMLWDEETGVEFHVEDGSSAIPEFIQLDIDPPLDRIASFRWGCDIKECAAGRCCAAALSKLLDGAAFDESGGKLLAPDDTVALARNALKSISKPTAMRRLGTRPAHIKQFLKSLLEMRSDLAMVGRALVIRPVRHVLRGAYFGRTSDPYAF